MIEEVKESEHDSIVNQGETEGSAEGVFNSCREVVYSAELLCGCRVPERPHGKASNMCGKFPADSVGMDLRGLLIVVEQGKARAFET